MKNIKSIAAASLLSAVSFSGLAQNISVTDTTLDGAEAQIAAKAKDRVHMTAVLGE